MGKFVGLQNIKSQSFGRGVCVCSAHDGCQLLTIVSCTSLLEEAGHVSSELLNNISVL